MNRALGISVVIACLHDEQPLARLLARLRASEGPSTPPLQIIVVDAAASAHCRSLCQQHQALWSPAEPCRGEQLRQGAALAEHEILWFLHADAELDDQAPAALRQVMADGAAGGYFAFRFSEARCWQSWLLERLVAWRNRVGTPYGDQGLFARRSLYFAAGQHAPWPLFEEVPLVKGLRNQGDFCRLAQGLRVSPRRWKRDGWWRRSCRNRLLAIGFMLGISPATLARLYSGRSAR